MGLRFKLFGVFGGGSNKMKEKKTDSFFNFRRSGTRYSFVGDKNKTDASSSTQIHRLSWSSFPMLKFSPAEEKTKNADLPCLRSKSSDNLKKQAKSINKLCKSKSSSIFKSSSTTIKNPSSSSYPSSTSSSCSSASSSPKVRQSWASGVTHILERGPNDNLSEYGDDSSLFNEYQRFSNGSLCDFQLPKPASKQPKDGNKNKYFLNCTKSGFPVSSLLEENEEDEIMSAPKIICAHRKTPDVTRKTRNQIMQELEYIKELGMLPEELETKILNEKEQEKENISPNIDNYPFIDGDLNLNSLKGYKNIEHLKVQNNYKIKLNITNNSKDKSLQSSKQDELIDKATIERNASTNSREQHNKSKTIERSCDYNEYFGSNLSYSRRRPSFVANPLLCSSLNSILIEEDSDVEDSETMTSKHDEDSSSFEKRLEEDLEKLDRGDNAKENTNSNNSLSDEEEKVIFRRKPRHKLHIDIQRTLSNDILLRRITGDGSDTARSSRSSPRTPRSPAIDIDDVFDQRQKEIETSSKDNLTQVKDLTQRLRLSTKSLSSPVDVEWLNGMTTKSDTKHLVQVMSPVVLDASLGERDIGDKQPTEGQRKENLSKAMSWIREELIAMKEQDQRLARQLVHLQVEMQRLRLHRSCTQHEALLEEVTYEEEDQKALMTSTDLIDLPNSQREGAFMSLRDFGVTKMNIANRRFTLR